MFNHKWRILSYLLSLFSLAGCGGGSGTDNQQLEVQQVATTNDIQQVVITNSAIDLLPSYNDIAIRWDDLADNENGFIVERRVSEQDNFSELIDLPANSEIYTDTKARVDKAYCYRIGVYNEYGMAYSEEICTDNS